MRKLVTHRVISIEFTNKALKGNLEKHAIHHQLAATTIVGFFIQSKCQPIELYNTK